MNRTDKILLGYIGILKIGVLIGLIALSSCQKDEPLTAEMDLQIDSDQVEGIIPSLRSEAGEYHLTGSTKDEIYQIDINLGPVIYDTYELNPEPIQGHMDPVCVKISGSTYTLIDSSGFFIKLSEQNSLYSGSYHGNLWNQTAGYVSITSTFENL